MVALVQGQHYEATCQGHLEMKNRYFDAFLAGLVHGLERIKLATTEPALVEMVLTSGAGNCCDNRWSLQQQSLHWCSATMRWRTGTLMLFWTDWLMVMTHERGWSLHWRRCYHSVLETVEYWMTLLRLSKSGNWTEFRGNFHRHLQDRCTSMLFNLAIIIFQKVRPNNPPCSCVSAKSTSIPLICLVKPVITYNLPAYQVLEPSWDALKMRYAAIHIVKLPITVRAPWRATRTYESRKKNIALSNKGKQ